MSASALDGSTAPKRALLLDVDTGVDDALAIGLAMGSGAEVVAITTVAGNTRVDLAQENTLRVLRVFGRTDIPVYRGADRPLDGDWNTEEHYFGHDGFGGVSGHYDVGVNAAVTSGLEDDGTPAALKIIELARARPGQLTLVLLGPLTNAAIALLVDPHFTGGLREMVILGGNRQGRGNAVPGSEFNFHTDPEAAHIVLQRAQCPVTIVPWETSLISVLPWVRNLEPPVYHNVVLKNSTRAQFLADVTRHTRRCCEARKEGFNVGDALAVLTALSPASVLDSVDRRVAVELSGHHTRGQLVQAWSPTMLPQVRSTVKLVQELDRRLLADYVTRAFS
ncbi:inosine-uridine preferring nucleoside hydrolase [Rhipicephalus sanguineus]|uniref:inosine-uridine preferring nucleoside hydrolase n=1 Tax=Rhipicephalus sanguineus TaxID=34632 RepID=UPI0020C55514|nr:inosine-uridine preferring nucleoside hydrolase [Rhipicephalus sanguineus]